MSESRRIIPEHDILPLIPQRANAEAAAILASREAAKKANYPLGGPLEGNPPSRTAIRQHAARIANKLGTRP